MATNEMLIASLCLLTDAAWEKDMPTLLTRPMLRRLLDDRTLEGLVLHETGGVDARLIDRIRALLSRAGRVASFIEDCKARGYAAMARGDGQWPAQLEALGAQTPHFLFLKGNSALLNRRMIAVAGSRRILSSTRAMALHAGIHLAQEGFVLVSGGADGVDDAVQRGALEAGGCVVLVPAMPAQTVLDRNAYLQSALDADRLLLLCDSLPDSSFSAQKALARNHTIYALGEAALVLASRNGAGGSWRGALDCLRGGFSPVFTPCVDGPDFAGNAALMRMGAKALDLSKPLGEQILHQTPRQIRLF